MCRLNNELDVGLVSLQVNQKSSTHLPWNKKPGCSRAPEFCGISKWFPKVATQITPLLIKFRRWSTSSSVAVKFRLLVGYPNDEGDDGYNSLIVWTLILARSTDFQNDTWELCGRITAYKPQITLICYKPKLRIAANRPLKLSRS